MRYEKYMSAPTLMGEMYATGNLTDEEYRGAAAIAIWLTTIEQASEHGIDYAISGDFIARIRAMVA